jgi:DNA-binding SARP family transcriptional activator
LPAATQRLVALLALRGGALSREYVAGVLWIDHSQGSANASLRTALWRLKRLCAPVIDVSPTYLALSHDVALDVQEITEVAKHLTAGDATCSDGDLHTLMRAGELLPDWYDDWVVIDRERFRQTRLHALDSICNVLTRQGRYGLAVEVGLTAIAAEPLRESAHRAVMRAHLEEGNPGEALRQYELCRRLLHGLGLEPSIELEGLRTRCRRRDAVVTAVG